MARFLFIIRSLGQGGAERQLTELTSGLAARGHAVAIATLYDGGALWSELAGARGVELLSLGKQSRWDGFRPFARLVRFARRFAPEVVHGYMPPANELALVVGRLTGAKVVWGLRASNMDLEVYDRTSRLLFGLGARLSRYADLSISNSHAGLAHHAAHGYRSGRTVVVPNGIDVERFQPDRALGAPLRVEWGVPEDVPLVGIVARIDPMKDHRTFLRAAARVVAERPTTHFVSVGGASAADRAALDSEAKTLGLGARMVWAGPRRDMPAVYNALDLLVSSSAFGEGFSNSLGEAMACGIPCVATLVGDSAEVLGEVGGLAPARDDEALARAILEVLALDGDARVAMAGAARARIVARFSREVLIARTEQILVELAGSSRAAHGGRVPPRAIGFTRGPNEP